MPQTAWAPPNSNPAWGVLIPQKMLAADGMTQTDYKALLQTKLANLIEWMDPAEQRDLDEVMGGHPATTPQEQAAHLLGRAATPILDKPVTAPARDRELEAYLAEEQLTEFLDALRSML